MNSFRQVSDYLSEEITSVNTVLLFEIEQRIAQLSSDERAVLITRLVHDKDIYRLPDADMVRHDITEMAQDPEIQRELKAINEESACMEMAD